MVMNRDKKKRVINQREIKLYELLGISHSKRLLLSLEKIKNRKSGKRNPNYHFDKLTTSSITGTCFFCIRSAMVRNHYRHSVWYSTSEVCSLSPYAVWRKYC